MRSAPQGQVGLEDVLGDDDPRVVVELGGAAGEEGGLAREPGAGPKKTLMAAWMKRAAGPLIM